MPNVIILNQKSPTQNSISDSFPFQQYFEKKKPKSYLSSPTKTNNRDVSRQTVKSPERALKEAADIIKLSGGYDKLSEDNLCKLERLEIDIMKSAGLMLRYAYTCDKPFIPGSSMDLAFLNLASANVLISYQATFFKSAFIQGGAYECAFLERAELDDFVKYQLFVMKAPFEENSVFKKQFFTKVHENYDSNDAEKVLQSAIALKLYSECFKVQYPVNSLEYTIIRNSAFWEQYQARFNLNG